jgi:hypothetical protein
MSYAALMRNAAAQAQNTLARLGGMEAGAAGNFVGPDGSTKTLVFRAADALEAQSVSREMTLHGYDDRSVVIATATRDQFSSAPLDWRRKRGTRLIPEPQSECLIAWVSTDDPLQYVFTLLFRQPIAPGS